MSDDQDTLAQIWRWLPAFRLVAEVENVSKAGRLLGLSAPAVSRALQKVEQALGQQLFDRRGRQLKLNPHGAALLSALRDTELRLRQVLGELSGHRPQGLVRLGVVGQLARTFLLPAVRRLGEVHPEISLSIVHLDPADALTALRDGALDWFLALNVAVGEPLEVVHLGHLELAIYAGQGHPLFEGPEPELERTLSYGFVAQRRPGLMRSVWPSGQKRRVSLQTDSHALALEACLAGTHLMVMERVIARRPLEEGLLREFRAPFLQPASLVLVRNTRFAERPAQVVVGQAIQAAAQASLREALSGRGAAKKAPRRAARRGGAPTRPGSARTSPRRS